MKKLGWVGIVAAALLLAGCSAPVGQTDVTTAPSTETPSVTPEPLAVEETTTDGEAVYLEAMRSLPGLESTKDAASLAIGEAVCKQLVDGVDPNTITAVTGGEAYINTDAISIASQTLCPEMEEPVRQALYASKAGQ